MSERRRHSSLLASGLCVKIPRQNPFKSDLHYHYPNRTDLFYNVFFLRPPLRDGAYYFTVPPPLCWGLSGPGTRKKRWKGNWETTNWMRWESMENCGSKRLHYVLSWCGISLWFVFILLLSSRVYIGNLHVKANLSFYWVRQVSFC